MINITFKNTLFKILAFVPMHLPSSDKCTPSFLANCSHSLTKVFPPYIASYMQFASGPTSDTSICMCTLTHNVKIDMCFHDSQIV